MKRLVYVITRSDCLGGAQNHIQMLSPWMINNGFEVTVIVGGSGKLINILKDKNIEVIAMKNLIRKVSPLKDIAVFIELAMKLKKLNPDIVSCHSFKAGALIRMISILGLIKKCIFTAHGWSHIKTAQGINKYLYIYLEKILNNGCKRLITVCHEDYKYCLTKGLAKKSIVETIYNGVPDIILPQQYKKRIYRKGVNLKLITISRLDEPKDPYTLLKAMNRIKDLNWDLTLIGNGNLLEGIKSFIKEAQLTTKINLIDENYEIETYLQNSDVFILSSKSEGFPRSILESMRSSLPVVASNVGGIYEAVIPGVNGELFESGDDFKLASEVKKLIENPKLIESYGKEGRLMYESNFRFEIMSNKTKDLYKEIIESN